MGLGSSDDLRVQLALSNGILANEGALDVFGHVSVRDTGNEDQFLLARACSPANVGLEDILAFTLDSEPVQPTSAPIYKERVIHGCIYQRRPDVVAICHLHAPSIMPFCITGAPIVPVSHVGATIGRHVPTWSSQAEFGDTNMLISTPEQGHSLAHALGDASVVLIRNHGGVVVGRSLREVVLRTIFLCQNAALQLASMQLGPPTTLTPEEIDLAADANLSEAIVRRAWDYWTARLTPPERRARVTAPLQTVST